MGDFELGPRLGAIKLGGSECVLWTGAMRNGYGVKKIPGKGDNSTINAHRYVYEQSTGKKIPKGYQIDHTCRNRRCINPKHMEPVSVSENKTRAWAQAKGTYKHRYYKGEVGKMDYTSERLVEEIAKRDALEEFGKSFKERVALPSDPKERSKRKKQYAAAGVGAAALPFVPTAVKVPGAPEGDQLGAFKDEKGNTTSKTAHLRHAVTGESFRFNNDAHTAQLANTIRDSGGFDPKHPVTVGEYRNGERVVIAGHHRIRAAEMLGVDEIPTRVVPVSRRKPLGLTPLVMRGKFKRDVAQARVANPKMSREAINQMADKKTGAIGSLYNRVNGALDVGALANRVTSNTKVRAAAVGTAGVGAGVAGTKAYERHRSVSKSDTSDRYKAIGGAGAGAAVGAGSYLGLGYGLKRRNEKLRGTGDKQASNKAMKAHKKAYPVINRDFFRNYPEGVPGWRTQRMLGYTHKGASGRGVVQGSMILAPAAGGFALMERHNRNSVSKAGPKAPPQGAYDNFVRRWQNATTEENAAKLWPQIEAMASRHGFDLPTKKPTAPPSSTATPPVGVPPNMPPPSGPALTPPPKKPKKPKQPKQPPQTPKQPPQTPNKPNVATDSVGREIDSRPLWRRETVATPLMWGGGALGAASVGHEIGRRKQWQ